MERREPSNISLAFHSLLQNHPDVTLDIIQALLAMRFDFGASELAEAMAECKKIVDQRGPVEKIEPGIFSSLKMPSKSIFSLGSKAPNKGAKK